MKWPLCALGFLSAVAFWPGVLSQSTLPKWGVLAIAVPGLLWFVRLEWTLANGILAAWLAYAGLSVAWSPAGYVALNEFFQLCLFAGAVVIAQQASPDAVFRGAAWGIALQLPLVAAQRFDLVEMAQVATPAGLFVNRNFLAEAAVMCAMWAFSGRKWGLFIILTTIVALSGCRSAMLAWILCMALWFWPRSKPLAAGIVLIPLNLALILHLEGLVGNLHSISDRLDLWLAALRHLAFPGHGLASTYFLAPLTYPSFDFVQSFTEHWHNDPVELAFELGVGAGAPFALFLGALLGRDEGFRLTLGAFGVCSLFGFPLALPTTCLLAACATGGLYASGIRKPRWANSRRVANNSRPLHARS